MDKRETAKLLALIKVAYPTAYRDMDEASTIATVNMWQSTFPSLPYPIMEMAFDRFRKKSKFPPTVAEMFEELEELYHTALEDLMMAQMTKDTIAEKKCLYVMEYTNGYRNGVEQTINYNSIGGSAFFENKEPKFITGGD
jgi:hypothetical protein